MKSERQHLYHIYRSMWTQFRLKKSLWVIFKIVRLYLDSFTYFDWFIIDQAERKFSCKKSPLVICKIVGHFVNALTADDNYSLLKRGNLLQHFQTPFSKKQKIFSQLLFFFFAFWKFRFNFEHFEKNDDPHRWYIFELTDSEIRC